MKFIIDAYQFASDITGTDRMAHNFLVALQEIDNQNQYIILCSSEHYIPSTITAGNFTVWKPPKFLGPQLLKRIIYKMWRELTTLRLRFTKADTYLTFHNMRLPRLRVATRMITSNLDLIPLQIDEYRELFPGLGEMIKATASRADAFLSISQFSKDELSSMLDIDPQKITVIHLAADERFSSQQAPTTSMDVPEQFIFTLGGSEPRKNVQTVVEAFTKLPENLQAAYPLLIAGGSWHGRPLEPLQVNDHVRLLGYVSEDDLPALYRQATAFVFASRYEGFGFTILEAMASGTPVISANSSSLAEVAGDAALLFDPLDVSALQKHLEDILESTTLQQQLRAAGTQQVQKFSWHDAAQKLLRLLSST